ncbi:hypothetical protein AX16_002929 [Volvariella volvacea WC 439]|nr:hypothetical protein AX16_002929 [Volvariella volvacea WC 439]
MATPEAFLLLTLANASLAANGQIHTGQLNLQCVTMPLPDTSNPSPSNRDVYLVLWIGGQEIALDPARIVQREDGPTWRTYHFHATEFDPTEMTLKLFPPVPPSANPQLAEDLETFHGILAQYADVRFAGAGASGKESSGLAAPGDQKTRSVVGGQGPLPPPPTNSSIPVSYAPYTSRSAAPPGPGHAAHLPPDLRGHVVMVNEDTGEIIGELDHQIRIHEDPNVRITGREGDAVIIEVPDERSGREQDATAMEMFVRAIPPEQQDWITKSATIVSHTISATTSLLLTTITAASNYYISHSTPHNDTTNSKPTSEKGTPQPGQPAQPAPPSRTTIFLTSERTRKNLSTVHAVSGKAVQVSSKTVSVVDDMIRRAMGGKAKGKATIHQVSPSPPPPLPSRSAGAYGGPSHAPYPPPPPQSVPYGASPYSVPPPSYQSATGLEKPPLPSRGPSPAPPLPPRSGPGAAAPQPIPGTNYQGKPLKLGTKAKILLSADLILSTIDDSARKLLDGGTDTVGNVVGHKYGSEAKESSLLAAGTARNVGLVYIDLSGMGRRALLKRAGKQYIKANFSSGQPHKLEDFDLARQQQQPPAVPSRPGAHPLPGSAASSFSSAPPSQYPYPPHNYNNAK